MRLTVLSGPEAGHTSEVADTTVTIGRAEDCDIVLTDAQASRRHAEIRPVGDGRFELVDLGSSNGTYVNGTRLDEPLVLGGTQQVQIGDSVIALSVDGDGTQNGQTVLGARRATHVGRRPSGSFSGIQRALQSQQRSLRRALILGGAAVAIVVVLAVLLVTGVIGGGGADTQTAVENAVARVTPSTALVQVMRGGELAGTGSGWVYDAGRGLIVTNAHVVNGGSQFKVAVGGRMQPASVVAVAPCEDLAVLRVANTSGLRTMAMLAAQDALRLGQTVIAVGFPQSASADAHLTSTTGTVSVARLAFNDVALDVPQYPDVTQTDVPINPGNSGGPLVDLNGRLVGVNSAGRTSADGRTIQGQGFAIGIDRVRRIVPSLAAGHSTGWTGMAFDYPAAPALAKEGLPPGLLVTHVVPGTPAAAAGFGKQPMLVTAINGTPVDNTLQSYCQAVRGVRPGSVASFRVMRGVRPHPATIRVRFA